MQRATREWLEQVVMGMNLCPFARASLPGLRIVGFERRISIAFGISGDTVIFYRFLYGGRDLDAAIGG